MKIVVVVLIAFLFFLVVRPFEVCLSAQVLVPYQGSLVVIGDREICGYALRVGNLVGPTELNFWR